jgi:uncharacterized membrane protein
MTKPSQFNLEVYRDGVVHVEYAFLVNQTLPQVNVTLLGNQYQHLVIVDENDTLLDYAIAESEVIIDSLGAQQVHVEYDGLDLTNKTLGIWTIAIAASINYTITFPIKTTILDLNEPPMTIESIEQHPVLTMPAGEHIISYQIETVTPQEEARALLDAITTIIAQIRVNGVDTAPAEQLLQAAEDAYTIGNYNQAELLAMDALELAYALEATGPAFPVLPLLLGGIGFSLGGLILIRHRRRTRSIDTAPIFRVYPWLREDQRDVVRYLAQRPDGVFEAELRRVFRTPKSSMWRLIKKLEEEGILHVEQLRQQNYIKLRKVEDPGFSFAP